MLKIVHEDITKLNVDAIVNAANEHLLHLGGVARAIANADETVNATSREWISKHGKLKVSQAVALPAKKWKYVIHVVGPRGTKPELLRKSIENVFKEAEKLDIKSIALPAISCGIFGFEKSLGSKIIFDIAKKYAKKYDIFLVSIDKQIIDCWQALINENNQKSVSNK